jgi:hypothetical protein
MKEERQKRGDEKRKMKERKQKRRDKRRDEIARQKRKTSLVVLYLNTTRMTRR